MNHVYLRYSLLSFLMAMVSAFALSSCIEDDITHSPSHQPVFSVDTLKMGTVFTEEGTRTFSFKVYNRHDKVLSISSVAFKDGGCGIFRLNVDGQSGTSFNNVEIRPGDSIFVFVAATLPSNVSARPVKVEDNVMFVTNGVTSEVVLSAYGQDVKRYYGLVVDESQQWDADYPVQVFDSLVVAEGVTLTLAAGSHLYFHDGASLKVDGTLVSEGTAEAPVMMEGDRQGNVITGVSFDLMSRQWEGVLFRAASRDNRMTHTTVRNTWRGVSLDSLQSDYPSLMLVNCTLRNAACHVLDAYHSSVRAVGCEFAESGSGAVRLHGAKHDFNHCTFSNYYLFSAITGPLVALSHVDDETDDGSGLPRLEAEFTNSVLYGSSADLSPKVLDDTQVYFRRCLIRSSGDDDDHFTDILWNTDPMFYTDRGSYLFDYRLRPMSPVIGEAYSGYDSELYTLSPVDNYGTLRPSPASIGAYEPVP